jgi:hypothetical protein
VTGLTMSGTPTAGGVVSIETSADQTASSGVSSGSIVSDQGPPPPPSPVPYVATDDFCNNGIGCSAFGDILAQCVGLNVSLSPQYVCQCSSFSFIPPTCISVAAQQIVFTAKVQQYSDDVHRSAYLQKTAACQSGYSACPTPSTSSADQQSSQLQSLGQARNSLQMQLDQVVLQYEVECSTRCPSKCPSSCSPVNIAGCPSGCPLVTCFSCAAHFVFLSSLNESLIHVREDIIRIQNQKPPEPSSLYDANNAGTCVASVAECFNTSSPSELLNAIRSQASFCYDSGSKYCPLLGCVSKTTLCIPIDQCPEANPKRCPHLGTIDGGTPCVPAHATCPTIGTIQISCPLNQTLCPGGLHCAPGSGASFFQVFSHLKQQRTIADSFPSLDYSVTTGLHVWP